MSYTITADPIQQNTNRDSTFFLRRKRRDSGGEWTRGKRGEHAPALSFPKGKPRSQSAEAGEANSGVRREEAEACSLVVISQADGSERRRLTSWGVKRVAGFAGFDAAEEWEANEGEVADEVEGLVAAEFVGVAEGTVHYTVFG